MLSTSAGAYEFTSNADADTYHAVGALIALLEGQANEPMLCKNHPTPKINQALAEWRGIDRPVSPWFKSDFERGIAQGKQVLKQEIANLADPRTKEQCSEIDKEYSRQSDMVVAVMKQAYIIR